MTSIRQFALLLIAFVSMTMTAQSAPLSPEQEAALRPEGNRQAGAEDDREHPAEREDDEQVEAESHGKQLHALTNRTAPIRPKTRE